MAEYPRIRPLENDPMLTVSTARSLKQTIHSKVLKDISQLPDIVCLLLTTLVFPQHFVLRLNYDLA